MNKEKIKQYLLEHDAELVPVLSSVTYPVNRRNDKNVYRALLRSIVSQQLSVKAAATIHTRLLNLFPENDPTPELLLNMTVARLRSVGLSKQKASYIKAVATFSCEKGLAYEILAKKNDAEIIKYLTQIHGVGRWTVEMLLIFIFNRKDIFPIDDVGIQNAMRKLYGLEEEGKDFKDRILLISKKWQPYRTVVSRYLWAWK